MLGEKEMACGLTDYDVFLFHQGNLAFSYRMLGAHCFSQQGVSGVRFSVWAPNAEKVSVVGDFNNWTPEAKHCMRKVTAAGIWTVFISGLHEGDIYKYLITCPGGYTQLKADPYAFAAEVPPATASRVAYIGCGHHLSFCINEPGSRSIAVVAACTPDPADHDITQAHIPADPGGSPGG
jgi:1,4-alpha-glucan branching enzyme